MMGCAGKVGDPKAKDEVERESSKVAAVACFFPPTEFLVLKPGPKEFEASFDFREFSSESGKFERVTRERRDQIAKDLSPLTHAGKDSAPTMITHGEDDKLVPITQSQMLMEKLADNGVECKLSIKPGKARGISGSASRKTCPPSRTGSIGISWGSRKNITAGRTRNRLLSLPGDFSIPPGPCKLRRVRSRSPDAPP